MDDGFLYSVPEDMEVSVGSLVRVPLGGRRVRGWVVATGERPRDGLRPIISVSGTVSVFDERMLGAMRWAAMHYVAPLAAVLRKTIPPNVPRCGQPAAARGRVESRAPTRVMIGSGWGDVVAGLCGPVLASGRSALVVAPTVLEAEALAESLGATLGEQVQAVSSSLSGAAVTKAWCRASTKTPTLLVGTREVAAWPVRNLGLAVVVGEGRRGMKDKATPTVHVRDLLLRRSATERFDLVLVAGVPTAEALSRATDVRMLSHPWGLAEIVDRREEPPGRGLFSEVAAAALKAASDRRVLLFTHRRSVAQRCVKCRRLRACGECGASPGASEVCARCGAAVAGCLHCGGRRFETLGAPVSRLLAEAVRMIPRSDVGPVGSGRRVVVGTERDLPGLEVDLSIIVDGDGPIMAPNYRAGEEGLRLLGRAVAAAGQGRGRRAIVQTFDPEHGAMVALRTRDPLAYMRAVASTRAELGFPPGGEVLVLEATPVTPEMTRGFPERIGGRAEIHGPAETGTGARWLVQGRSLDSARVVLRQIASEWRESGVRVRIDADPVDL